MSMLVNKRGSERELEHWTSICPCCKIIIFFFSPSPRVLQLALSRARNLDIVCKTEHSREYLFINADKAIADVQSSPPVLSEKAMHSQELPCAHMLIPSICNLYLILCHKIHSSWL